MAKKATKKVVRKPTRRRVITPVAEPVNPLVARREELLALLDTMNREGFRSVSNIEHALSVVNKELD